MQAYILRRLLLIVPTMVIVSIIVFSTIRLIPGDVIDYMVSTRYFTVDAAVSLREKLGLNLPAHVQYGRWITGAIRGDFGESLITSLPVTETILQRLPRSMELGALSLLFALLIALPVGIYSGMNPESIGDQILRSIAILFICIPSFWLGTMILILPAVWFRWSPPMHFVSFWEEPLTNLTLFIIPAIVLGMWLSGVTMRLTRTMMLEVLRQDYIRTAWAKGLRERVVVLRHALKNALNPVLTMVGLQLPVLIGGAVVVEHIFNLPGIGSLVVTTLAQRDYTILSALNLMMAVFVLLVNVIALEGPSAQFPLGTDHIGRDLLSRVIRGARISMVVGVGAVAIGLVIALFFGLLSGYWGGLFDLLVQRLVDAWLTFPWLFIVLTVMSLLGQGMVQMIVVLGAFTGIGNIRTVRGVVLSTRQNPYVEAARAVGCPTWRILLRHVLPQVWPPIIVVFTVSLGAVILSESTISFLGFGIPPPQPSWGGMLSLEGRTYMEVAPLLALWPGLSLAIVVFGINMFGDALRDLLNPRLTGGAGRLGAAKVQKAAKPTA